MGAGNAQVQGLFTHVRLHKVGRHGYDIQNVKSYKFEVTELTMIFRSYIGHSICIWIFQKFKFLYPPTYLRLDMNYLMQFRALFSVDQWIWCSQITYREVPLLFGVERMDFRTFQKVSCPGLYFLEV